VFVVYRSNSIKIEEILADYKAERGIVCSPASRSNSIKIEEILIAERGTVCVRGVPLKFYQNRRDTCRLQSREGYSVCSWCSRRSVPPKSKRYL